MRMYIFIRWIIRDVRLKSFFFSDTATTEIYTLSLHDALPISRGEGIRTQAYIRHHEQQPQPSGCTLHAAHCTPLGLLRSEEHTSELQSLAYLVCRLLLGKKIYMLDMSPLSDG